MSIFLLAAAAAAISAPSPAAPAARGYQARMTQSGVVCLRPTTVAEGVRLDIPRLREECRPTMRWEQSGLRIQVNAAGA